MLKNKIKTIFEDKRSWILAILIFLNIQPYFVWHIGAWGNIISLLTLYLLLINSDKRTFAKPYFIFWVITVIIAALCGRSNILGIIMMLLMTGLVFTLKDYLLFNVYKKLHLIYALTITISMVMWVLVVVFSVNVPYHIVEPIVAIKEYNYSVYPFLVRTNLDSINFESLSSMYRFCGLFDEPGVVGTVSFLFLCIERFKFSNRWNVAILFSGLLSMSLFFYLASSLYFLGVLLFSRKVRTIHKFAAIFLVSFFAIFSYNNKVLNTLVWSRVENQESAQSIVDSRSSDELKKCVDRISGTTEYYFGVADRKLIEKYSSSSSIYNVIIGYGMITLILYSLFFIIYSYKFSKSRKSAFVCLAVIALTLVQRPGLFIMYYLFLFRSLILVPRLEGKREHDNEHNQIAH